MTPPDEPGLTQVLRDAAWDLPLTEELLARVRHDLTARTPRRLPVARWPLVLAAAAAVVLVVAGAWVALGHHRAAEPAGPAPAPTSRPQPSGSAPPPAPAPRRTEFVGRWAFEPPAGMVVDSRMLTSTDVRFGPAGLVVRETSRAMSSTYGGSRLDVVELAAQPTPDRPWPTAGSTAPELASLGAAQRVIVTTFTTAAAPSAVTPVPGLPLGPGWLITTDPANPVLIVAPTGNDVVLAVKGTGVPAMVLVTLAQSLHPDSPDRVAGSQPTVASQSPA